MTNALHIVHDPRFHSMIRSAGDANRIKRSDPRWSMPRFLERLEDRLPTVLHPVPTEPPHDARAVWFALPDPQSPRIVKRYQHWSKGHRFAHQVVNHPQHTTMSKREWYFVMNMHGIRAPHVVPDGPFTKTMFHGAGPTFACEYIESRNISAINPRADNPNHKVWRIAYFDGHIGERAAYMEETGYWVQSGGAQVRELKPVPPEMAKISARVAEVSKLRYFHIEIIPSPWAGPVVCDVNPHPFDVLEGRLNDIILEATVARIEEWLDAG